MLTPAWAHLSVLHARGGKVVLQQSHLLEIAPHHRAAQPRLDADGTHLLNEALVRVLTGMRRPVQRICSRGTSRVVLNVAPAVAVGVGIGGGGSTTAGASSVRRLNVRKGCSHPRANLSGCELRTDGRVVWGKPVAVDQRKQKKVVPAEPARAQGVSGPPPRRAPGRASDHSMGRDAESDSRHKVEAASAAPGRAAVAGRA